MPPLCPPFCAVALPGDTEQRAKARYFNVDSLLEWATLVLAYQQGHDFSEINPCFCLDQRAKGALAHKDTATVAQLQSLKDQVYSHRQANTGALQTCLAPQDLEDLAPDVLQSADLGRRYLFQKLGWLQEDRTTREPYTSKLG